MRKLPGDSHSSSRAERPDLGVIGGYSRGGVTLAATRSGNGMVRPCSWALPASRLAGGAQRKEHAMSEKHNSVIAVIGIDIGKNSFHVVGLDGRGAIALRQKWSRGQVETRLANMPACLIGMEACVGAHHLSRPLRLPGPHPRLMPAQYVRAHSKAQKNDFRHP